MKKYLNMVGNIIFYSGIKVGLEFMVSFIFCMIESLMHPYEPYQNSLQALEQSKYCIIIGINLFLLFVFILIFSNKDEDLWKRCRFKKTDTRIILISIILGIGISIILINMISFQGTNDKLINEFSSMGKIIQCPMGIFNLIVFIPIFEEILFRGLIFNELRNTLNIVISLVFQGMIFALFYIDIIDIYYGFFIGIVLGLLYYWIGSIWANIITHSICNIMFIVMLKTNYIKTYDTNTIYLAIGIIIFALSIRSLYKISKKNEVFQAENSL